MRGLLFPYLFARVFLGPSFEDVALQFHASFVYFLKVFCYWKTHFTFMKLRTFLSALVVMTSGCLFAQNATKADLDKLVNQVNALSQKVDQLNALSQKVNQLETDLERVITENVNLVEQLNIKTVTSMVDNKNGITFDIVKVEPDVNTNDVVISLRITNNSGAVKTIRMDNSKWIAYDSDSNKSDNSYKAWDLIQVKLENGIPVNATVTFKKVPTTCSYLSLVRCLYSVDFKENTLKFTGVHVPW